MSGAPCTIRKDGSKWHVERDGQFIRRCDTKRQACLIAALFAGNASAAVDGYRLEIERASRKIDRSNALRAAQYWAVSLGLSPGHVRADADTGEPLEGGAP